MQWNRAGLIASWEFSGEHDYPVADKYSEKRSWGAMVIIKSLQFLPSAIDAVLKETKHSLNSDSPDEITSNGQLEQASTGNNMLHIALVGINNQMSSLQDRFVTRLFVFCC